MASVGGYTPTRTSGSKPSKKKKRSRSYGATSWYTDDTTAILMSGTLDSYGFDSTCSDGGDCGGLD